MKKIFFIFLGLSLLILYNFWGLWQTYFQQDEWNGFGVIIALAHKPIWAWFSLATSLHFFPLNSLTWLLMYRLFGFQAQYYAITAIILHIVASFLVYVFAKKLSGSEAVGILTSVLFATNSRAREAIIHLGVFSNTIPFFIFVILFLIALKTFTTKSVYGIKEAVLLGILFLCAVLFREDGFILLPILFTFLFIYNRRAFSMKNVKFFIVFLGIGIGFFIYRILLQLITPHADSITGHAFLKAYFYNGLTFPFKLIVQNLLDGYYSIQMFLYNNSQLFYPNSPSYDAISSVLFDLAILIIFNFFTFIFFIFTKNIKNVTFWKNIYFSLFIILVDAAMLASIGRRMERIEERYLYVSGFAVLFILSLVMVGVYKAKSKHVIVNFLKRVLIILIIVVMLVNSLFRIQSDIQSLQKEGSVRKKIISSIVAAHPQISKNTIFFVKCAQNCYRNSGFGIPNQFVLPFSSGPGWIILLQYAKNNESVYKNFFDYNAKEIVWNWQLSKFQETTVSQFLWDAGSQGYRKIGTYGFGYFTDLNLLRRTLQEQKLSNTIVIGLEYNEKEFSIKDISKEIQKEL